MKTLSDDVKRLADFQWSPVLVDGAFWAGSGFTLGAKTRELGLIRRGPLPKGGLRFGLAKGQSIMSGVVDDLENLPKALGFFVGSALSFVSIGFLPSELRTLGLIGGAALAAGGIITLLSGPSPEKATTPGAAEVTPGVPAPIPEPDPFEAAAGRISFPTMKATVQATGFWSKTVPVVVTLENPTGRRITVDFEVALRITPADETAPTRHFSAPLRVELAPRTTDQKTVDFNVTITRFGGVAVYNELTAFAQLWKVAPGGRRVLLDAVPFDVVL